ncbi:polycystic kidney disease protein 1-like 1 isoform X3 [Arapaima gigas]
MIPQTCEDIISTVVLLMPVGPEVYHRFLTSGMNTVSVEAQNRVGSLNTSASILVLPQTQSVRIHTEKQTYLVGAIITFLAMCEEPDPLEFLWHFGEGPMQRTVSRSITKKYHFPGRYNIVVHASSGRNTFISDIHPIVVQRKVQINRLLFNSSVLLNTTVPFDCRINAGTNVTYAWSFGDGTYKTGGNTEHHIYEREGEFTVEVTVSNLVSSASLRRQIFVVSQPCHPPPVKNMGPVRIQVRRYQTIHLGVTYDGDIHCNISQGLLYSWALYESTGTPVQLSHIETQQQRIQLPSHFLHYGIYTVIAKVQIQGSVVYSNYTVHVEVVPSPPVCLIYGGTNIFISISNSSVLTLNGQGSYDPDYLENILRYQWHCKPVSNTDSTCFDEDLPTSSPVLVFPSSYLKSSYDQFKFTLTVMSGDRSTSSEVFVTVTSHMMRWVHLVHCENCQGTTVNWNEQFSVKTLCENCEMPPEITFYTWDLYLVNASSKVFFPLFTERFKIPVPPYYISEFPVSDDGSILYDDPFLDHPAESPVSESSYHTEHSGTCEQVSQETPLDGSGLHTEGSGTLTGEEIIRLNYKDWSYFTDIEEGSIGNSRGIEKDSYGSSEDFLGSKNGEDNLMDSSKPSYTAPEKTLLDLERRQINPAEFITYTTTGINSHMIRFKPFALKPKTQYMLEVSASAQQTLLGKTQFFFSTDEIPQGMACQAQPTKGYEIHTEFSIFCSSGKMDLLYKYSYSTGRSQRRVLYQGRDFQYYFSLPSGEPQDNYKVTIYTEVWNQFGAATRPCPVSVQVLPSYQRNVSSAYSPDQRLYLDGLETLTKLALKGNGQEVRNHIFLFTNVLNRLSQEPLGSRELQTITRSVLISAVSQQTIPDQFCEQNGEDNCFLDEMTVPALVSLLSFTLETLMRISKKNTQLISHVIHTAADLLLKHVLFSQASEYSLSTSLMEVKTFLLHRSFQKMVKNVGSTKFYFPDGLNVHIHGHNVAGPYLTDHCIVGQLMSFKQSPYLWEKSHIQMHGHVADMALYNCSTRTEIKIQHFSVPITAEFQPRAQNRSGALQFSLQRSHMNVHQFNVTPENLQEVLLVTLHFDRPTNRTFPIMILLRIFERPTPTVYNVKKIHRWEGDTALVFLPLSSLSGPSRIYLALLNANYNEVHGNKYVTSSVNYTMVIECIQCLFWDGVGEWKPDGCIAVEAESSSGFKCSCNHLTTFTAAYREIQSHLEFICVSHFVSLHSNLTLCSVALISLVVYLLSAVFCKQADAQYRERGLVHLPDNSLSDRQLYAVTVDTGFRSRPTMTAKVHIVLHGENVISQTRELHFSNQLLFARNSRHTFILSTPESLGPIWKVHLWHDNRGSSPSWYISHVAVRDLMTGASWLFPGECWLAVDEGDGRVERVLPALTRGLGFRKLLYSKLTEYLEDLHSWASVYSRPSYSHFTHIQRLSVCLLLLEGYMCANAVLLSLQDHQATVDLGPFHMPTVSLVTGVFSTLVVLPVGALLSLLFRLSEVSTNKVSSAVHKQRPLDICSVEVLLMFAVAMPLCSAHSNALTLDSRTVQPHLSWQHLQQWAQEVWIKKEEHTVLDSQIPWQAPATVGEKEEGQGICHGKSSNKLQKNHCEYGWFLKDQNCDGSEITLPPWCRCLAWTLCVTLSLVCGTVTAILGTEFSATKCLLWFKALFSSLLLCGFVLQPALIFIAATVVAVQYRRSCHFHRCSDTTTAMETLKRWNHNGGQSLKNDLLSPYAHPQDHALAFSQVIAARQRARRLRLARPPTLAELRVQGHMKKQRLIHTALREAVLHVSMLFLLMAISAGKSSEKYYLLNEAIKTEFTRSAAVARLQRLREEGWLSRNTQRVVVQFTLFNPPTSLFTAVSLLVEQSALEGLLPSAVVQSTTVYRTTGILNYVVMACEFYFQMWSLSQQSLRVYWGDAWNWLEATITVITLLYYMSCMYSYVLAADMVDLLQQHNFKAFLTATVLIIAFSCLKTLHFLNPSHPFSDLVGSFQRVLIHCVMIGVVTSITKAAKKDSRRKDLVTFSEMAVYIQNRIHVLTGKRKKTQNAHHTTHCNFYLEELEVLVVELLDKLETITDNLHHIHPSQMVGNKGKERSVTPWMDLTCGQIFEVGIPGFFHIFTTQLKPFQQRLSPEVTCPAAFGVSSHPQHLEELRMESITEMTLTEGIKSFSSYNDSAVSSGQSRPCNLAQHRDVFPHLLCESKCPGKQAVHCCQTDLCTRKLCTCHSKAHKPFPLYPCVEWEGHEQVVEAADRSLQVERSLSVNTLVQCSSAIAKNSY